MKPIVIAVLIVGCVILVGFIATFFINQSSSSATTTTTITPKAEKTSSTSKTEQESTSTPSATETGEESTITSSPDTETPSTIVSMEQTKEESSATTFIPTTTLLPSSSFSATGSYSAYSSGGYTIVVFTGNGSIRFNGALDVSVLAVGGGGGGAGGKETETNPFLEYWTYIGGNGGTGGAHILASLFSSAIGSSTTLSVTVGSKGLGGSSGSSGGTGEDTTISNGSTNYITCKGGSGGVYNGSNDTSSSYFTYNSSHVYNIQAGGKNAGGTLQGGQGGTGGQKVETDTTTTTSATAGANSATYTTNFSVPSEVSAYVNPFYAGGGGAGNDVNGGNAGNGAGGTTSSTLSTGASATLYGAGGGGGAGSGSKSGGSGAQGVVVFYFSESSTTTTTTTATTTIFPATTTFKPLTTTTLSPSSNTIWLDASSSSNWSAGVWKNSAPAASSNATTFTGTWTTSSLVTGAIKGLSALFFDGTNSLSTTDPAGTYASGATLFIVFQPTGTKTTWQTLVNRAQSHPGGFGIYNTHRQLGAGTSTTYMTSPLDIKSLSLNVPYLLVFRVDVKNSVPYISEWLNGSNLYSNTTSTATYGDVATGVYIGSRGDKHSTISLTGYMGEMIMHNKALTDAEILTTTKYLASKWGITVASSLTTTNMTIWLDASISNSWTAGTWNNSAVNKISNATTFAGTWTTASLESSKINGLPGLKFDGTNSLATTDTAGTYTNGFTLFVVFQPTSTSTYRTLVSRTSTKYPRPFDMYNNTRVFGSSTNFVAHTCDLDLGNLALNTSYVYVLRVNGSTATASEWINGYSVYSNTKLTYYGDTASKVFLGTREDKVTSFTGHMGEVIMYKTALTDTEVTTTTNYLMGKWGIPNVKDGSFLQLSGALNQVDIDDDLICGATSSGVVYCKDVTDSYWTKLPTTQALTQVSVNDGEIYGVNSSGNIYYSANGKSTTAWSSYTPGSSLSQIDANGDVICGVNSTGIPYCKKRTDSGWTKLTGGLTNITVNSDGTLFGVNGNGMVYYKPSYDSATGWTQMTGATLNSISADNNVVCGTNKSTYKTYCTDTNIKSSKPTWYEVGTTPLEKVSVSKNRIAGVNTSDVVYMT